ncbi:hypothetical protein [Pseudomonas batumici]|nr:hypothetical protein [Pseudomonas batumici]
MSKIKILAGDFLDGHAEHEGGYIIVETALYPWPGLKLPTSEIADIRAVSEASHQGMRGTMSLSLAGAMVLGPVGAIAGLMLADEEKEVTFSLDFRDGRSLLCVTDGRTYRDIEAAAGKHAFFK